MRARKLGKEAWGTNSLPHPVGEWVQVQMWETVVACGGSSIWVGSGSSAHLPQYTLSVGLQARC